MELKILHSILSYLSIIERKKISIINKELFEIYYKYLYNKNTSILICKLNYGYLNEYYNINSKDDYNYILNNLVKDNNRRKLTLQYIVDTNLYFPDKKVLLAGDRINTLIEIEQLFDEDYVSCKTYDSSNFDNYDIIILSTPLTNKSKIKNLNNKILIDFVDDLDIFNEELNNRIKLYNKYNYQIETININLY